MARELTESCWGGESFKRRGHKEHEKAERRGDGKISRFYSFYRGTTDYLDYSSLSI